MNPLKDDSVQILFFRNSLRIILNLESCFCILLFEHFLSIDPVCLLHDFIMSNLIYRFNYNKVIRQTLLTFLKHGYLETNIVFYFDN